MEETIVAPATPAGRGGVSIVRLSGKSAARVGGRLCGELPEAWSFKPCSVCDRTGSFIDSGLVVFFAAPRSYTGEDVVEIHCHGNPLIVDSVISAAISLGARVAEPGEFTKRAFLNEKIDIAQAESVADLIAAQTSSAVVAASASLSGEFSGVINETIDRLIEIRVLVEACLDFSDEDSVAVFDEESGTVKFALKKEIEDLEKILKGSLLGSKMRDGVRVVILGPPNCGKSTLLNYLAKEDVAIVSDDPGTTRDLLRVTMDLGGLPVEFVDTAGLHEDTSVGVELEGMRRALASLDTADVVVLMSCVGEKFDVPLPASCNSIRVFNKVDILSKEGGDESSLFISALTGEGVDVFIKSVFSSLGVGVGVEVPLLARRRHLDFLEKSLGFLRSSLEALESGSDLVIVAEELREAQKSLGSITRPVSSDELLGSIFSRFCIGK